MTLKVNGAIRKFGRKQKEQSFWHSGGCTFINYDGYEEVEEGPWIVDRNFLPLDLLPYEEEIETIFNANVAPGCCGGCL